MAFGSGAPFTVVCVPLTVVLEPVEGDVSPDEGNDVVASGFAGFDDELQAANADTSTAIPIAVIPVERFISILCRS